ncbi:hypothetical protein AOLI_G00324570 [Acnodon oligacanthus]
MAKLFAVVLLLLNALGPNTGIKLDGNGYTDILIAINPAVPQNDEIINQIKGMIINGSDYLFQALDHKVFIKEVKILVPPSWNGSYHKARRETYKKARIIIEPPQPSFGDDPYTKQMKGCGEESEYTHFTPNFLLNDGLLDAYGPRGRVFVHEWAHLRWGVYDEYNEKEPFYFSATQEVQATRCTREITGQLLERINGNILSCRNNVQSGLPTKECQFFPDREQKTNASIMYMQSINSGNRMLRQQQAATLFLSEIVEEGAYVGIVTFSTGANILNPLMEINGKASRDSLIEKLPKIASGSTNMCTGLARGFEVLKEDDQSTVGDDVIFLTDGEATDDIAGCLDSAVASGAIINTLALGPDASTVLTTMATLTGGLFVKANDSLISNQLVEAFSSFTMSDGDPIKQTIQLVSTGKDTRDWFNGTVPIDHTVGNSTTFTIIYERSAPTVYIQAPSGSVYDQRHITDNTNTITLNVPGTAEPGDWKYSFLNTESTAQAMALTVTSRAARNDVPPVTVQAQMNQQTSDGTKPMIVFAEVSQNRVSVLGAKVIATLQSDTGHSENLYLLDNGAGADNLKDDGIYSRYFTKLRTGRYSLKVEVTDHKEDTKKKVSPSRYSSALYIPGYIVDGQVQLNAEKPPVSVQSADVGSFTRTVTGESFVVSVPPGVTTPNFPPNKITDLSAEIQEDTVFLNWTAPGEDFDQGTAESYEIRWSEHLEMLLNNFSNANLVNTSALQPQEAGSDEQFSFLSGVTIQNGTTLFFAVQSEDKEVMSVAVMAKLFAVVLLLLDALGPNTGIKLDGNGYTDILIAINPAVPQNDEIINQIKEMITSGSEYLFQALDNKVFYKEVKILVPPSWNGSYDRARRETYSKANVIINLPHPAFGDDPYTKQMKGCGEESEYTHFTPDFLLNDGLLGAYGPRGRVFVHEWAHLRWGVYDEYNEKKPFYFSATQEVQATRCTREITGQLLERISGNTQSCRNNVQSGLPTKECQFFPDREQKTNASIMYMQSINSVTAFCHEGDHNAEAPNMQNQKCDNKATRTVIFQDSVDRDALQTLTPLQSSPPPPTFSVIQRQSKVVCLILDVSGSMQSYQRLQRLQQAATIFLRDIVEEGAYVGIVKFSGSASIVSGLIKIDGDASRQSLISKLPQSASGSTNMCNGLRRGFEVLQQDDKNTVGDEVIFLTDGQATDNVQICLPLAVDSGAIINTLAFGPSASNVLITMANLTDGKFQVANDNITSNELVDAFSSFTMSDGDPIKQTVQLVSTGRVTHDWFNGTVPIDRTVGNSTTFTIIYERSAPTVYIQTPSGSVYDQTRMTHNAATKTLTLNIPGTAEPGDWRYSFLNTESSAQAMTLTVTSRAARNDVPPVTVKAQMSQLTSDGSKPMVVFAEVSQNYNPVLGARVMATLQSDTGHSENLHLLDNGAGADDSKDDGIYSRYFTKLKTGKYSLKVQVSDQGEAVKILPNRYSGALYIPGYIVDGQAQLNPEKPPVNVQSADVGSFTRTVTGESFVVSVPPGVTPPNFPPNKITDLSAEIQEDTVLLNWTAPGEEMDEGTGKYYSIPL